AGSSTGSSAGACSAVASSGAAGASVTGSSFRAACCCAASVALKSSASGPSRMLARLRAIEHLLPEASVRLRGRAGRVGLDDGAALHRRFCVAHGLPDAGLEDEVAEVLLEDLDRLARVQRPRVVH